MMTRSAFTILLSLWWATSAFAQGLGLPQSHNASGTIAVTNTFQSIWTAQARSACTVQNNGTHTMYLFFGPIANATLTNSMQVTAGTVALCNIGTAALTDQISITGTSGDAFYANQQ